MTIGDNQEHQQVIRDTDLVKDQGKTSQGGKPFENSIVIKSSAERTMSPNP